MVLNIQVCVLLSLAWAHSLLPCMKRIFREKKLTNKKSLQNEINAIEFTLYDWIERRITLCSLQMEHAKKLTNNYRHRFRFVYLFLFIEFVNNGIDFWFDSNTFCILLMGKHQNFWEMPEKLYGLVIWL